ncbi:FeoB-associated Cys-rich membrane protein [Polaribacter gangjinensis]|uniref:FeoB-associated Cys-rich membrane protein n=1 Tax=Polaribacter gangjinensis TaxID=574710 RepID=A0A2S7WBW4_9FLAO|nr:FeoB-associated Cys-rich membrane protein [Polaribacter gangjinensis]PQJ75124.1 hypothetical protein BTO13_07630 [Polaribacter gangjinensis]
MQQILVYVLVGAAVLFLLRKYVFNSKKSKNCSSDCGCH